MTSKAQYVMIGGFLGAGKTTAILRLAQHLYSQGRQIGLITNDQSFGLVDTVMLASYGFAVEEITGGCFCCRFNSLVEASERLSQNTRPDAFIAEPVGSCTDLMAAVNFPLRRIYGEQFRVAPLSVVVDPIRAERILGLAPGPTFSKKVLYVYGKQLEEAEIIVINKCDLLDPYRLSRLESALRGEYPHAEILQVSARDGGGLESWFDRITREVPRAQSAPEVDYELYAAGEALLGWLNASVDLSSPVLFDGNRFLGDLMTRIRDLLEGTEIAHLKMTLLPREEGGDIGVINLVRSDGAAEMSHALKEPLDSGELLINLRAEGDPQLLQQAVLAALSSSGVDTRFKHVEQFRPAKPEPTFRMAHA